MTQIEFYLFQHSGIDAQQYLVATAARLYRSHKRVHIHCDNAEQARQFSTALWQYSQSSFLANATEQDDTYNGAPITLATNIERAQHFDSLVYFGTQEPEHISRFGHYCWLVPADDASKNAARARYRFFKQRGYPLNHHPVT